MPIALHSDGVFVFAFPGMYNYFCHAVNFVTLYFDFEQRGTSVDKSNFAVEKGNLFLFIFKRFLECSILLFILCSWEIGLIHPDLYIL